MIKEFLNAESVRLSEIPVLSREDFERKLTNEEFESAKKRVLAYFKLPDARLVAVLGNPYTHKLEAFSMNSSEHGDLTERVPALHRFERALRGKDDLKPFVPLKGAAAHEVAVGPVHAGVIEPGHFRFQCMGEDVYHLEIQLGYQHRGAEELIVASKSDERRLAIAETVAGDASIAARLAAVKALNLDSSHLPPATSNLLLELERIANHVGDLGALSGDVAYLPTQSFCGRIRGEYLNMTAAYCGNRFGRGGAKRETADIKEWFLRTKKELFHALDLLFSEPGAVERYEHTGRVNASTAREIGLVGMAGRASGLQIDSRIDFPMAGERIKTSLVSKLPMTGDVFSRARQRYEELKVSHAIVEEILEKGVGCRCTEESFSTSNLDLQPPTLTIAVVEAWRGELVHAAVRDENGELKLYKIFDPSFHNWFGLAQALRGEQISNFPICNKSFNLSYCGVDR